MFLAGDKIAHPMHGAGIIENIVRQRVDGQDRDFYLVRMITGSMTVLVPCDPGSGLGVRAIISPEDAQALLDHIPAMEAECTQNWNLRYRENMMRLKSGDLEQVACVIKSLTLRDRNRGLSTGERKLLTCARNILISEVSLAMEQSYETVEQALGKLLI